MSYPMNINILEKMNKVPGGLIIIPLLAAILINTFAPENVVNMEREKKAKLEALIENLKLSLEHLGK